MTETTGQDLPDRAEEKRVDTPQNETAAPVEQAQAGQDAGPTEQASTGQDAAPTEQAQPAQDTAQNANPQAEQTESE